MECFAGTVLILGLGISIWLGYLWLFSREKVARKKEVYMTKTLEFCVISIWVLVAGYLGSGDSDLKLFVLLLAGTFTLNVYLLELAIDYATIREKEMHIQNVVFIGTFITTLILVGN